jgi:hypothetical protein
MTLQPCANMAFHSLMLAQVGAIERQSDPCANTPKG